MSRNGAESDEENHEEASFPNNVTQTAVLHAVALVLLRVAAQEIFERVEVADLAG